jgi:hypothetical protein
MVFFSFSALIVLGNSSGLYLGKNFHVLLRFFLYAYFSMHTMCLIKCLSDDLHVHYMIFFLLKFIMSYI